MRSPWIRLSLGIGGVRVGDKVALLGVGHANLLRKNDNVILAYLVFPVPALKYENRFVARSKQNCHVDVYFVTYTIDNQDLLAGNPKGIFGVSGERRKYR